MKVTIHLNDNNVLNLETESFDPVETINKLNDQKLLALSIGNVVLNKNAIMAMAPEAAAGNVQITMHNGLVLNSDVEAFNASEIAMQMNEQKPLTLIGGVIANKNAIKLVMPIS